MPFVTRRAPLTVRPSPTPGNTKELLHWPMRWRLPSSTTGSNGLPVATIARPSDQRIASSGVHSVFEVGLESGKMIGRALTRLTALTTASSKVPGVAEVPISMVGFAFSMVSSSVIRDAVLAGIAGDFVRGPRVGGLERLELRPVPGHEAVAVGRPDATMRLLAG